MATHYTTSIPFSRIHKIGIFNNQSKKQTLTTVYNNLKGLYPNREVYIANCGFFNMTSKFDAIFGLKAEGTVISNDWSNGWIGFQKTTAVFGKAGTTPTYCNNAVTGYPVLIEEGKKSSNFSHCIDNTDRGRTMLGFTDNELVLSVIADTAGASDFTLDEELNYMLMMKCNYAINLDGGGSSQCNFNGKKINSSRKVNNLIYIVADPDNSTPEKQAQVFLNNTYKSNLAVDGSLGPATKKAIIKAMQKEIGVTADGYWGSASKKKFTYLGVGSKNNTVNKLKILQCALCRKGYWDADINGLESNYLKTQIKAYQRAKRLSVDGVCGPATITSLFS